jgi:hypothetical protein
MEIMSKNNTPKDDVSSWEDTIQDVDSSWEDSIEDVPENQSFLGAVGSGIKDTTQSAIEAIPGLVDEGLGIQDARIRGGLQGISWGTSDEIIGGAGAIPETIRQRLAQYIPGSPENVDKQLRERGFTGDIQQSSILENYRQIRDAQREANKEAEENYPINYTGSEIVAGLAPAVLSGGAAAISKAPSAINFLKSIGQTAKAGAKYGALEGVGRSEADLTKGEVSEFLDDVTASTGSGAVLGGGLKVVGKGLSKGGEVLGRMGKSITDNAPEQVEMMKKLYEKAKTTGQRVLGGKAGLRHKAEAEKLIRDIGKYADDLKDVANKDIGEVLKTQSKFTEELSKLEDFYNKYQKNALTEDAKKYVTFLGDQIDSIKAKSLKSGYDPSVLKLPTEEAAMRKLSSSRQKELLESQLVTPEDKALKKLADKAALTKSDPESLASMAEIKQMPGLPDVPSRTVFQAADLSKEAGIDKNLKVVAQQLVDEKQIGPIEKSKMGMDEFLSYRRGVQTPKTMQIRPQDIYDPNKQYSAQELINIKRELKSQADKYGLNKDFFDDLKGFEEDVIKKLSPEQSQLYKSAMQKQQTAGALTEAFGEGGLNLSRGVQGASAVKAGEDVQKYSDALSKFAGVGTKSLQTEIPSRIALDNLRKIDPSKAEEISKRLESTGFDLYANTEASKLGISPASLRWWTASMAQLSEGAGLIAGSKSAKSAGATINALQTAPTEMLNHFANNTNNPKIANFLRNLAKESPTTRAAVLFQASQNPGMKEGIYDAIGYTSSSNNEDITQD